jgi:hypothetical protein
MDEPNRPQAPAGQRPSQTESQAAAQAEKTARAAQERGSDLAQQAQGRAADVARTASDRTAGLANEAQDRAGKVAGAAQDRAAGVMEQAREGAADIAASVQDRLGGASERKDDAAETMDAAAGQAHKAADKLRDADQRWLSDMVGAGADELGAFAEMIRSNDFNGILQRVRGVARSQPALFAGASVAAGFALARMARVAMEEPSGRSSRERSASERPHSRSEPIAATARDTGTASTPPAANYPGATYNG